MASADGFYIAARLLIFAGLRLESPVLAHHAIERYLKGYLVGQGEQIVKGSKAWGHKLSGLGKLCSKYDKEFDIKSFSRRLSFFDKYFEYVRYPTELDGMNGMIWFSFDSNISPLDEVVAFIRPRILQKKDEWGITPIHDVRTSDSDGEKWKKRALEDSNNHIELIDCNESNLTQVNFDSEFDFDSGKC